MNDSYKEIATSLMLPLKLKIFLLKSGVLKNKNLASEICRAVEMANAKLPKILAKQLKDPTRALKIFAQLKKVKGTSLKIKSKTKRLAI